ncbi:MarR family transcriptional regulator [Winogradskya consettensis]|uniref:MarR family transcriptional regulator n=1 Tax=Winogradskya consettensis TaxID=113560 RepID=A0A919SMI8_9ACTN|nr:MarR family transcriptional regulator [Actinoplanes consettensis]GIM74239.1 MarR family transcriptional regulator [Actinoplanes consettensis]
MRDTSHDLGADLQSAVARIYSRFRSERSEGELGDAAVGVLIALAKNGALTLTELSERARVTTGSMSQTVNRLVTGGYVDRARDPADGRRMLIETTPAGAEVAAEARAHRVSWLNARLAELTPAERATLAEASALIRRIADS